MHTGVHPGTWEILSSPPIETVGGRHLKPVLARCGESDAARERTTDANGGSEQAKETKPLAMGVKKS